MGIEKYLKDTPDLVDNDSAWASTDGENLKFYKLSNAGANIDLSWCYATNFNNTNFNENSYVKTDTDSLETAKTGITCPNITTLENGRYLLDIDDSNPSWNKIGGGFAFGVVRFNTANTDFNFDNIYICSNLDYSRLVINTSAWDLSGSTNERSHLTDAMDKKCSMGYRLNIQSITTDNKLKDLLNLHIVIATIGDDGIPVIKLYGDSQLETQISERWYQTSVIEAYKDKVHELPYYSNTNYRLGGIPLQMYNNKYRSIFTIPHTKQSIMYESRVWHSQYGDTYAASYYSSVDVQSWTRFMNSTGLRYYDGEAFKDIDSIKANMYMGIMDENGVTDCDNRIMGWNEIESSDLPNKDRNGYNWDVYDPTNPPDSNDKDDDSDDINFGGSYAGLGAFAKFYLCSGVEVSQLNSWINGRSPDWPENFDPMTQIISISRFATDISSASFGSTTIKFHTAAGAEIDTKIPALHGNGDNIELDLGSVNIPLRMKERGIPFLDYESTIELYIPACGTFILDPQTVLGSTLSVKMWLSTSTGDCNSIAYVIRNGVKAPVAYGSGSLAVPMPITSVGWGSYLAAITNSSIKYSFGTLGSVGSGLQFFGGMKAGNQYAEAAGLPGMVSSFQNLAQAEQNFAHLKNSSFTSVSGSFGSTAAWNYPFNAYVKITRRHFKKPSNYAHTRGIPLVETKTLRDCSGFTICVNTDVSSINATIQEKNMIVDALNNGVIV